MMTLAFPTTWKFTFHFPPSRRVIHSAKCNLNIKLNLSEEQVQLDKNYGETFKDGPKVSSESGTYSILSGFDPKTD